MGCSSCQKKSRRDRIIAMNQKKQLVNTRVKNEEIVSTTAYQQALAKVQQDDNNKG